MNGRFLIKRLLECLFFAMTAFALSSCKATRHVPDNQFLLNRIKIKSDVKDIEKSDIKQYLRQRPNTAILGRVRLQLNIYNMSGKDTSKWINRKLRSAGEAPVIFNDEDLNISVNNITTLLQNKGYINAVVTADTTHKSKKKVNVRINIKGNAPYTIKEVNMELNDDTLTEHIRKYRFNIKEGDLFDIYNLKKERDQIVTTLRNDGFYYFDKSYITIEADTTIGNHQANIYFRSLPMKWSDQNGKTTELDHHKRVKINKVNFYPWEYNEAQTFSNYKDTLSCGDITYFYHNKRRLCPKTVYMRSHILPGDYFSEKNIDKTNNALSQLGTTKYTNIYFRRERTTDSLINCNITLSPNRMQSFSFEVEGTNTDGDLGAALSGTYTHRNIFHGAEELALKARLGYLPMGNLKDALSNRSLEAGGEMTLTFPRVLFPFIPEKVLRRIKASTKFSISYNYQTTPWYDRDIANAGIEYWWVTGSRDNERYSIKLLDISYVYLPTISEYFKRTYLNTNSAIKYSYEDHIIMALGFTFSRNNRKNNFQDFFSYRGSIETAGNILSGICSASNAPKDEDGSWKVLNIRYSQYVKGEFGYSYNQVINDKNKLVYHFNVGVALPYGNADVVPFEKRFYAGGANSVRGWAVRSLGPGVYNSSSSRTDFNQCGDIKLDLNFEYRFKLFWVLEGAAFIDAGNVWTIKEYDNQQGGKFYFNEFYKQLACSYGIGLRFDFSFFLIRIDGGAKLYDPVESKGRQWRKPFNIDDMALHLAIGYPF